MNSHIIEWVVLVGTFFVGIYQTWGIWKQWRTVVNTKSGEAIVLFPHITNLAYFSSSTVYAVLADLKLLAVIALASGIMTALLLSALATYQRWTIKEFGAMTFLPVWLVVIALLERGRGETFAPISVLAVLVTLTQPMKMWKTKKAGAIDVRLYYSFAAGGAFWSMYAWMMHEPVNSVACPIFFVSHLMTITLYRMFKRE